MELPKYTILKGDRSEAPEFKYTGLQHYIDFYRSYPNADGNIINAKPLFYHNPKLVLLFVRGYVYAMFNTWEGAASWPSVANASPLIEDVDIHLDAFIKDPAEDTDPGVQVPVVTAEWNNIVTTPPMVLTDIQTVNNIIMNGLPCWTISNQLFAQPVPGAQFNFDQDLKPLKLYHALFKGVLKPGNCDEFSQTVHTYAFQTSRYSDFAEQVNSFKWLDSVNVEKKALYEINKSLLTVDHANAVDIINNETPLAVSDLTNQFADRFNRLMDGAIKLGPLNTPIGTEVNVIRDHTNKILGLLVRNPEPFNDPKLPNSFYTANPPPVSLSYRRVEDAEVVNNNGLRTINNVVMELKYIHSKDRSQVFITSNFFELNPGLMRITFRYFEFNGTAYTATPSNTKYIQFAVV